jgi:hypothetical protein
VGKPSRNETTPTPCKESETITENPKQKARPMRRDHERNDGNVYAQAVPKILDRINPEKPYAQSVSNRRGRGIEASSIAESRTPLGAGIMS